MSSRSVNAVLAGLGAVLVLAGIVYFFAYNGTALHRFAKFAVLEAALLIAVALAWRLGPDSRGGRAALLGAAVLPGVLLALSGQTYHTGPDPYLHLTWGLLITPWLVIGHSAALWLLWLVLANMWLLEWYPGYFGLSDVLFWMAGPAGPLVLTIDIAALAACELLAGRWPRLSGRWIPRLIALMVLGILILWMASWLFRLVKTLEVPLVWLGITGFGVWVYSTWRRDLFIFLALAVHVIVFAFIVHDSEYNLKIGGLFFLLLLLGAQAILITGAALAWLWRTARNREEP